MYLCMKALKHLKSAPNNESHAEPDKRNSPANENASLFLKTLERQLENLARIYTSLSEREHLLSPNPDPDGQFTRCERLAAQVLVERGAQLKASLAELGELSRGVLKRLMAAPLEHSKGASHEEMASLNRRLRQQLRQLLDLGWQSEENAWALEQLKEFELSASGSSRTATMKTRPFFQLILQLVDFELEPRTAEYHKLGQDLVQRRVIW